MPQINLEYPIWFVAFCLIGGIAYAWLLYSKKAPWSASLNRILFVIRLIVVSGLLFLLLNPLLQQLVSSIERPAFVIALDNSLSIVQNADSSRASSILQKVDAIDSYLENAGYDVELRTLNASVTRSDEVSFDEQVTNIDKLLREIESVFEGRNLAGTLLVSDGNYNQGISPSFFPYSFPIYAVGIGDTTKKEDLILKNVLYNKIAYQGNKFPVRVDIVNQGLVGKKGTVKIKQRGKTIRSEELRFAYDNSLTSIDFSVEAAVKGVQRYSIELSTDSEEAVLINNTKDIFVDIIEGKQKILLMAPGPHPDIKAINAVIDANDNYDFQYYIPGINAFEEDKYDLIIVHQANDRRNRLSKHVEKFREQNVPILFVVGRHTNLVTMSQSDDRFNFKMIRTQTDLVRPAFNNDFSKFKYDIEYNSIVGEYPPIKVPYGDFRLTPASEVLLYQKVGSITTQKPMMYVTEDSDGKFGYIIGDGFWQWRLQEYALTEDTKAFDNLFLKLIQYLSTKEDKRKFKLSTNQTEYFDNEVVEVQAELYNDIYERIYDNEIELEVEQEGGDNKKYTFTNTAGNAFRLSALNEGVYRYTGRTQLGKNVEVASGRFIVQKLQLEALDQTADFGLLREVAANTGGNFFLEQEEESLYQAVDRIGAKGVLHTQEDFSAIINLKWLFFIVLILMSLEWFARKYSGGY